MKKYMVFFICGLFVIGGTIYGEKLTFETFKNLIIKDVLAKRFIFDESRAMDMRSRYHLEFKGDKSKSEMISISLSIGTEKFSKIDKLGEPESYKYKGRQAIYKDGKKAGMAGFLIILNNKKGKLAISHRVFGGSFLVKEDFEKIVDKIGLDKLEK